jgi:hypothetical protein
MSYGAVFNILQGMLALLGCLLVIMFRVVFREENAIHPIYRSVKSQADPDCNSAEPTITSRAAPETRSA